MGAKLLILLLLLLAACGEEPQGSAHDQLACASCHAGALPARGVAAVPVETCKQAGCHPEGGPVRVQTAQVVFHHRGHGRGDEVAPDCAGCHAHEPGSTALQASLDACILCHRQDVLEPESRDCAICHGDAVHVAHTDSDLEIPHATISKDAKHCLRCHYDVGESKHELSSQHCLECHDSARVQLQLGAGADLHPIHRGFSCQRCHGPTEHRIRALSSAVELDCRQCHRGQHPEDLEIDPDEDDCGDCHEGQHVEVQRMVLGLVDDEERQQPSFKFMAGLSCSSCHVEQDARPGGTTCGGCHDERFTNILSWWIEGATEREDAVRSALTAARSALSESAEAGPHLKRASSLLSAVVLGGPQHNLQLGDHLLHRALGEVGEAYRAAGQPEPQMPALGTPPRRGFCSSCHYAWGEGEQFQAPDADWHRRYLEPGGL